MKHRLAELIEFLSVPAFVISPLREKIVACNSLVISNYGTGFSEKQPFSIRGLRDNTAVQPGYLKIISKNPTPVLEFCEQEEAVFALVAFSRHAALVFETIQASSLWKGPGGKQKGLSEKAPDASPPFHFSYIHNFFSGKWSYADPGIMKKLGFVNKQKDLNAFDWKSVIHPDDLPLYESTISAVRKHGGNHEIHYRVNTCDERTLNVMDYCSLTAPDGKWPVLVGSIVSTERKYKDVSTIERQILTGRLVGGMVHDFKNLLGGIQNYIEWTVSLTDNQEIIRALKKTMAYTEQATALISGALKVNSSKKDSGVKKIFIGDIIRDFEDLIRHMLPSSIELRISIMENLPPVYGKRGILSDMLLNLCVNARDAMKKHGDLLVLSASLAVRRNESGGAQNFISLKVADNGVGMSKPQKNEVFEAFYSTKESGAGLGLWMVKEAVRSFDGRIEIASSPGKGTKFEILFPVVDAEPTYEEPEEIIPEVPPKRISKNSLILSEPKTILYIEDDPLIRSSVSNWLKAFGFNLLVSEDGAEGWRMFKKRHSEIDIIIQDLILPGRKGDQLLVDFQAECPDIPVVISSANPDEEEKKELLEKGAVEILSKPFKMEELVRILDSLVN